MNLNDQVHHAEPAIILTEQDATLLAQACEMLEDYSAEQRRRGNCSAAEGAECSAHAVQRLGVAMLAAQRGGQPAPAAPTDTDALARTETTARYLLGWKYGQMPSSPDTLLRQSDHAKAQWAWNAACKLLRFIDGSAPEEVQAVATEPMGPAAPASQAVEPVASVYTMEALVPGGREVSHVTLHKPLPAGTKLYAAPAAVAVPAMQWRAIKDGMPAWTDDNSIRVIAITAEDDFSGAQVHDVAAADFHIRDPEGPTDPDSVGTEVTRACTHWAYRDEIWPRAALAATPPAQAIAVPEDCPHLIWYDDQDRRPEMLAGHGARAAAAKRFQQISQQWNAHLFVRIEKNSRDCPLPVATVQAPQAQDVQRDAAIEELCQLGYKFDGGKMIPPDFAGELWAVVKAAPCACKYGTCETKNDRACRMTQEIAASAAQGEA